MTWKQYRLRVGILTDSATSFFRKAEVYAAMGRYEQAAIAMREACSYAAEAEDALRDMIRNPEPGPVGGKV